MKIIDNVSRGFASIGRLLCSRFNEGIWIIFAGPMVAGILVFVLEYESKEGRERATAEAAASRDFVVEPCSPLLGFKDKPIVFIARDTRDKVEYVIATCDHGVAITPRIKSTLPAEKEPPK